MLTQRSGRENTSSLLDVPKSCRCDPGHGQVSMITDNQSYPHFIFPKAAVTAGAKLKPSKFSDQNFMLTFLFFTFCGSFQELAGLGVPNGSQATKLINGLRKYPKKKVCVN